MSFGHCGGIAYLLITLDSDSLRRSIPSRSRPDPHVVSKGREGPSEEGNDPAEGWWREVLVQWEARSVGLLFEVGHSC